MCVEDGGMSACARGLIRRGLLPAVSLGMRQYAAWLGED